jgi:hypothetical protein
MKLILSPIHLSLYCLVCSFFLFAACKKEPKPEQKQPVLTIDKPVLNVNKTYFAYYTLTVKRDNTPVDSSEIKWTSSDPRIASVNGKGYVQALAAGETDILATLKNGEGSIICKFTVNDTSAYKFRIILKDKGTSGYSISNPSQFLSEKSIARRQKMHIPIDNTDLPISADYLKQIQNVGGVIVAKSKWLNTVSVYTENELSLYDYKKLPFVQDVIEVWQGKKVTNIPQPGANYVNQKSTTSSPAAIRNAAYYGASWNNINTNNGEVLHQAGYEGAGIDIAVIDEGFLNLNKNAAFKNTNIKGAKSFLYENADPYGVDDHGGWVTSCMGVDKAGTYVGTAPAANYWLFYTEDKATEYAIEEDYWTAAIEYADSVGVEMVNTSLYYMTHDGTIDQPYNYTYQTFDGKTAYITQAANMGAQKGIFIVCCAGNDNTTVGAPADSPNVLTVGSVDSDKSIAIFTSYGLTVDGRIKPDALALGGNAYVINTSGTAEGRGGTSYSAPNLCGLAACLWQAYPKLSNIDLLNVIRQSADRYSNPVMPFGYGIPDMQKAMQLAKVVSDSK